MLAGFLAKYDLINILGEVCLYVEQRRTSQPTAIKSAIFESISPTPFLRD
jgi:hypothetical protein